MARRTCPRCGRSALALEQRMVASAPTAQSLPGVQLKTTARPSVVLSCQSPGCGWSVTGRVTADGRHFDPDSDPDE